MKTVIPALVVLSVLSGVAASAYAFDARTFYERASISGPSLTLPDVPTWAPGRVKFAYSVAPRVADAIARRWLEVR
jgi:hypothetical protein